MHKNKILILEGGFNEEHEVSINTSIEVQSSLKRMKYPFEIIDDNLPLNHDNIGEYLKYGKESDTEFVYIFNGEWTCYNVRSWEGSPNVETIPEVSNAN